MNECPNLLATLAMDTPVNSSKDACVCRNPRIDITGILHSLQCLASILFTVELYTAPSTKIGLSSGKCLISSENLIPVFAINKIK